MMAKAAKVTGKASRDIAKEGERIASKAGMIKEWIKSHSEDEQGKLSAKAAIEAMEKRGLEITAQDFYNAKKALGLQQSRESTTAARSAAGGSSRLAKVSMPTIGEAAIVAMQVGSLEKLKKELAAIDANHAARFASECGGVDKALELLGQLEGKLKPE